MIKPVWIILENIIQNRIGHHDYGIFAALFSLGFIFIFFTDLGVNYYLTQTIASKGSAGNRTLSNVFFIKIILSLIYPVYMYFIGKMLGYQQLELYYLLILSTSQAFIQIILFFKAHFQGKQLFFIDTLAGVFDKLALIAIVIFLMFHQLNLENYIVARLIAAALGVIIFYILLSKISAGLVIPKLDKAELKTIITLSWPFAVITLLSAFNEKVDQVMLERLVTNKEAGLYAAAYRWLDAAMMYIWTIMPIFFARFSYLHKDKEQTKNLINAGQTAASIPMIFVSCFVFFYGEKLFWLFTNSSAAEITQMTLILKILFVAALFNSFLTIFTTYLNATGGVKIMSVFVLISALLNLVLNYIFIPRYGAIAAAFTTTVSAIIVGSLGFIYFKIRTKNLLPLNLLLKISFIGIVTFAGFAFGHMFKFHWLLASVLVGSVVLAISFLMNLHKLVKENF